MVVVERDVQSLVKAVSDPPGLAVGLQPLRDVELLRRQAGNEGPHFVFKSGMLADQQGGLGGERKDDVFGG